MKKELNGPLVVLIVSLFFLYQTTHIPTVNVNAGLGAAFYPRVILIFIISLSIISMIITFFKHRNLETEGVKDFFSWKVLSLFLAYALYIFSMELLGFILASAIFMMFTYLVITEARKSWKMNIIIFVSLFLAAFAISFIFENYLNVFLPNSSLF